MFNDVYGPTPIDKHGASIPPKPVTGAAKILGGLIFQHQQLLHGKLG
jgi:hypothetical protein